MMPDLAIFTVTWARDPAEEVLIGRALTALVRLGLPVFAADRTDRTAFTATLRQLGITLVDPPAPGLVPQVQAAAAAAATAGTRFLLYTEPDKEAFFADGLDRLLARAAPTDADGVVLAARSPSAFATFPPLQRYVETVVNTLCGQMTGVAGDYSYGPFLLHRALLPHIAQLPPDLGWGWRPSTFVAAHRLGLRVAHVEDELACPPDQRGEDEGERIHRLRQLSQNVRGLTV